MVNTRGGLLTLATLWWLPTASCTSGDVSEQTSVTASASSYDERSLLEGGCYTEGCEPDLTLDRLDTDVTQSRWSCEATETEPCYITYTFGEARMVERLNLYFTNITEDISVIISTLESSTDDDEEYVAQIIEPVTWWFASEVSVDVDLQPVPLATAVRIQADIPAGAWVSILEVYIYVTLEDDEETASLSSDSSVSASLVGSLVSAILFCVIGCVIYKMCCGTSRKWASPSASASASASSSANNNVQIMMPPAPAHQQTAFYPQAPMNGQGPVYATPVAA